MKFLWHTFEVQKFITNEIILLNSSLQVTVLDPVWNERWMKGPCRDMAPAFKGPRLWVLWKLLVLKVFPCTMHHYLRAWSKFLDPRHSGCEVRHSVLTSFGGDFDAHNVWELLLQMQNSKNKQNTNKDSKTRFAAAAKSLQSCPTLCDPIDGSPPGSPSLRFFRQEHWSGLPFPSPMH